MPKRTTITEKGLGESLSRERANFIIGQSKIKQVTPYVLEIIFYVFVLILLITGTYSRNRIWNSDIELWTDCVKKSPDKDRPHNNLGNAYTDQGRYQEAIAQLTEALRINPNYAEAHNNLGNAYIHQRKYQEAIAQLTEALRINPNDEVSGWYLPELDGCAILHLGGSSYSSFVLPRGLLYCSWSHHRRLFHILNRNFPYEFTDRSIAGLQLPFVGC
jgi:tetratricopeptide (TPR) repeat protein